MPTFVSSSRSKRSRRLRDVTYFPSVPANGDALTQNTMLTVGSSIVTGGSGRGSSGSVTVSPMCTSEKPASATISPGPASCTSVRSRPSNT